MTRINWRRIEKAAAAQIVAGVRAVREQRPGEHIYVAMFHAFYGDGETIAWPVVSVGTDETLAAVAAQYEANGSPSQEASLRWSGADLPHVFEPSSSEQALADGVQAIASRSGDDEEWEQAYERFTLCFPPAAKLARKQLMAKKLVGEEFIAIAADEGEELIPLSLTKEQLLRQFPRYSNDDRERARLMALSVDQRVTELLAEAVTPTHKGLLVGEHRGLLSECGIAAVPALSSVVRGDVLPEGAWAAAQLLAQINIDTPEAIDALDGLMRRADAAGSARAWAACGLARMDRADLILQRVSELPVEVVVRGITDPLSAFRDNGKHRVLDYAPLENLLGEYPHLESAIEEELKPGSAFCALTRDEVPIARVALDSSWKAIRTHARITLEDAGVRL